MAVEFCSENSSLVMSPRISFSYDLPQSDTIPIEQALSQPNSNMGVDFNFCIDHSFQTSADELFSEGKILPTQIKKPNNFPEPSRLSFEKPEFKNDRNEKNEDLKEKKNGKKFWGFKRSNSINCGNNYAVSLCPLPLLRRSNSTGLATNSKKASISRENHNSPKQNLLKSPSDVPSKNSPANFASCCSTAALRSSNLKPPLNKSYGSYGNGVAPVLNVHSGNLFGLGSIFSNGKEKNKKK